VLYLKRPGVKTYAITLKTPVNKCYGDITPTTKLGVWLLRNHPRQSHRELNRCDILTEVLSE
jgi:hypothetical protein